MRVLYVHGDKLNGLLDALGDHADAASLVLWRLIAKHIAEESYDAVFCDSDNPLSLPVAAPEEVYGFPSGCVISTELGTYPCAWRVLSPTPTLQSLQVVWDSTNEGLFGEQIADCDRLVRAGVPKDTAAKLLRKYGSLNNTIARLEEIRPKKLWPLISAATELETVEARETVVKPWALDGYHPALAKAAKEAYEAHKRSVRTGYRLVLDEEGLEELAKALGETAYVAIDTETSSLDLFTCDVAGVSIATDDGISFYVPIKHYDYEISASLKHRLISLLKHYLLSKRLPVVMHQAKFDLRVLDRLGISQERINLVFDTKIAASCLGLAKRDTGLKDMARRVLSMPMTEIQELIGGRGKRQVSFRDVPTQLAYRYACADADSTRRLYPVLMLRLAEEGLDRLYVGLEHDFIRVVVEMESAGVALDMEALGRFAEELPKEIESVQRQIYELAGEEFQLNSPRELSRVLFDKLGLPPTRRTPSGLYSTDGKELLKLASRHPIVRLIVGDGEDFLGYRGLLKLKSTYVDNLRTHPVTGRLHCEYHQDNVASGRLSSSNPNLQNIPVRTRLGKSLRQAFVAREGWILYGFDFSQIELRVMAHLIASWLGMEDDPLVVGLRQGLDVHRATAAMMFGKPLDEVSDEERRVAKAMNFGSAYGLTVGGVMERFGVPKSTAKSWLDRFWQSNRGIEALNERIREIAWEKGYTYTPFYGRKRYQEDLRQLSQKELAKALRELGNHVIQGGAAELVKRTQVLVLDGMRRRRLSARMILQVHDEVLIECPPEELEVIKSIVARAVERVQSEHGLKVPLLIEARAGRSWADVH